MGTEQGTFCDATLQARQPPFLTPLPGRLAESSCLSQSAHERARGKAAPERRECPHGTRGISSGKFARVFWAAQDVYLLGRSLLLSTLNSLIDTRKRWILEI